MKNKKFVKIFLVMMVLTVIVSMCVCCTSKQPRDEVIAFDKAETDGNLQSANKELLDVSDQIDLMVDHVSQWAWDYEEKKNPHDSYLCGRPTDQAGYFVSDLNRNGRLEIVAAESFGWNVLEVSEDGFELSHMDPTHSCYESTLCLQTSSAGFKDVRYSILFQEGSELTYFGRGSEAFGDRVNYYSLGQDGMRCVGDMAPQNENCYLKGEAVIGWYSIYDRSKEEYDILSWDVQRLKEMLTESWERFSLQSEEGSLGQFDKEQKVAKKDSLYKTWETGKNPDAVWKACLLADHVKEWVDEYYEKSDDVYYFFRNDSDTDHLEMLKDAVCYHYRDGWGYSIQTLFDINPRVNSLMHIFHQNQDETADDIWFPVSEDDVLLSYKNEQDLGNYFFTSGRKSDESSEADHSYCFYVEDGSLEIQERESDDTFKPCMIHLVSYGLDRDRQPKLDFRRMSRTQIVQTLYPLIEEAGRGTIEKYKEEHQKVVSTHTTNGKVDESTVVCDRDRDQVVFTYTNPQLREKGIESVEFCLVGSYQRIREIEVDIDYRTDTVFSSESDNQKYLLGGLLYCRPTNRVENILIKYHYDKEIFADPSCAYIVENDRYNDENWLVSFGGQYQYEGEGVEGSRITPSVGYGFCYYIDDKTED